MTVTGIEITGSNNQIQTPHYYITIPPNRGWYQNKDPDDPDILYIEKTIPPNYYIMRFSTNTIAEESMKTWVAKKVADKYRDGEQADMIRRGVMSGQYVLKDVIMDEEEVGDNKFYTMSYITTSGKIKQRAFLYLHFPKEINVERFLVSIYSESFPRNQPLPQSYKSEFLETLNSLNMEE
jgi:hypothetical protein